MQEEQIREALNKHWHASATGDANAEHDIYDDDAICDYPQSGERILGRSNLQALRSHHPGKPAGFNVKRILGKGDQFYCGRDPVDARLDSRQVRRHLLQRDLHRVPCPEPNSSALLATVFLAIAYLARKRFANGTYHATRMSS